MLNSEYRKLRNIDKPFTATAEESKAAWQAMNADPIAAKAARIKAFGKRRSAWRQPELNLCGEDFNDD